MSLALEMMETAWSILDVYLNTPIDSNIANDKRPSYSEWAMQELPRYLTGIGDALTSLERFADAADAYARALENRKSHLESFADGDKKTEIGRASCRERV